jgi:hypothetical protein
MNEERYKTQLLAQEVEIARFKNECERVSKSFEELAETFKIAIEIIDNCKINKITGNEK